ncbi:GNAT family N-acetyltransferase [Microbacterium sp. CJ88]|uniref:GNAT family N-acetyltransferase n=1 Tax=Microbacterium sp. CJ88 TaxID=3445672 RepID=UPI003F65678D
MTETLTITRIPVPDSLDAPDARLFRAIASLGTLVCRHESGLTDFDQTPEEILPGWQDQKDRTQVGYAAERDGDVVGVVTISIPHAEGNRSLEFEHLVHPDRWGDGIEQALLAVVEDEARSRGIPVIQCYTLHRAGTPADPLVPGTGWGSVPADDRQSRLLLAAGFTLEQVERNSTLDLAQPLDEVALRLAEAERAAGADYRRVEWTSPTPPHLAASFGYTVSRMSTDVPSGDLEWAEEVWDVDRVERRDARLAASGMTVSIAAVEHVPTGSIVAYNELAVSADPGATTHQWGTLVLKEHRGHRLGTIVKCANILRWRDLVPGSPRISTFNAEENRPMLDINEAIGFVPASYAGAWKKVLDLGAA